MLLFLSSCAGFLHKNSQEIEISSNPSEAYIYVDGWIAKTPTKITLSSSSKNYIIKAKKDGYAEKEVKVERSIRYKSVFLANLIWTLGYPYAIYVDFVSGHAFELKNTEINLEKVQ